MGEGIVSTAPPKRPDGLGNPVDRQLVRYIIYPRRMLRGLRANRSSRIGF